MGGDVGLQPALFLVAPVVVPISTVQSMRAAEVLRPRHIRMNELAGCLHGRSRELAGDLEVARGRRCGFQRVLARGPAFHLGPVRSWWRTPPWCLRRRSSNRPRCSLAARYGDPWERCRCPGLQLLRPKVSFLEAWGRRRPWPPARTCRREFGGTCCRPESSLCRRARPRKGAGRPSWFASTPLPRVCSGGDLCRGRRLVAAWRPFPSFTPRNFTLG